MGFFYFTSYIGASFVYFGAKPKPRLTLYEILRFISFHFYFSPVFIAFVISAAPGSRSMHRSRTATFNVTLRAWTHGF